MLVREVDTDYQREIGLPLYSKGKKKHGIQGIPERMSLNITIPCDSGQWKNIIKSLGQWKNITKFKIRQNHCGPDSPGRFKSPHQVKNHGKLRWLLKAKETGNG